MATISMLPDRAGLVDIDEHYVFTSVRLNEDPFTRPHSDPAKPPSLATQFDVLGPRIDAAVIEDKALKLRLLKATIRAEYADKELDLITVEAANACDKKPVQHKDLFGEQKASDFRRPVLNEQLEKMLLWPEKLASSPVDALKKLAPRAKAAVAAGLAAQAELKDANTALELFRSNTLNPLISDFNALRMRIFGELGEIQKKQGEAKGLGPTWPNSFFRPVRARKRTTLRDLDNRIAALKTQLTQLQQRRQELRKKSSQIAKAKIDAQRQAIQAQLEASRKAMEAINAKALELQAALEQLQNPPDQPDPDMPVDDILDDDDPILDDDDNLDDIDDGDAGDEAGEA